MLSRIAEDLYWLGRYVERADDAARLLAVQEQTQAEPDATPWAVLARACGVALPDDVGREQVLLPLTLDALNPASIRSSVARARENASRVRDRLTIELWTAVNDFHRQFSRWHESALLRNTAPFCTWVAEECTFTWGALDNTMPRDEGWVWIEVGRHLERGLATTRSLGVFLPLLGDDPELHRWFVLLRSVSANEAFRWAYPQAVRQRGVVEFTVLSPEFNRSLAFVLATLRELLDRLGLSPPPLPLRLLGRLAAELSYMTVEELFGTGLSPFLTRMADSLTELHEQLTATFFTSAPARAGSQLGWALHAR